MNGAVARAGAELGIQTPVNACLAELVEEVASDPQRRAWLRGHPERLAAELAAADAESDAFAEATEGHDAAGHRRDTPAGGASRRP
jgi:hypothetical protein